MKESQEKFVIDTSSAFPEQVDRILSGADSETSHLEILKTTPPLLRMVGVPNLPILMTAKHLKSITQENGHESMNYHGLDVDIVKRLPELLSDPVMIMDSLTRDDSIVIVTQTVDKENRPVIGAIKLAGIGRQNSEIISANILSSAYGKDNFQAFIQRNIEQGTVLYVDKEKSQALSVNPGIQFPDVMASLDFNTIIRKSTAFVNGSDEKKLENTEKKVNDMKPDTSNSAQLARERVQQVRDEMVKTLLEHIEKNPTGWQAGWNNIAAGAPYNGKTNAAYRGLNSLYLAVIGMQRGYKDTRWVTFNQAKELGASVKKGEKSSPVVFFEFYDRATKKAFDKRTVKDMTEEEKAAYVKENVYAVLKYSSVFNAEQCHNFPERKEIAMSEEERAKQNDKIETIIANSGAPVRFDGGSQAYYSQRTDSIHLPKIEAFDSMQDYYATALHEIAHSTGHESRLNRDMSGGFGSENYAKEELRAELACVFMQMENGIQLNGKHITNHAAYLSNWLEAAKKDTSVFFKAAADAQRIADYVADNYMQASNVKAVVEENSAQSLQDNSMARYLRADAAKREVEQQTILQTRLDENIRDWYLNAYPNDEAGQAIHPDAMFKDLQEQVEDYNHPAVYGMLGEDSVIRERAFLRLAEITNTTYEAVYSTYMGETAAQKLANARAQARQLAKETGEPYVTIEWTEKSEGFPSINPYDVMSLSEADKKLGLLDAQAEGEQGYYKTKLHIDFVFEGKPDSYENCRFDIGSEGGGLVHHIDEFLKYDTFLDAEDRAEAEAALEYFKQHTKVSEYLASPEMLAELSEEEQHAVNVYVDRARDTLNTTAPFAEYAQKMPPTPEDIADAIHGYSMEKPNLPLKDLIDDVHAMSTESIKGYAADYRAYLNSLPSEFLNDESGRTNYNYSASDLVNAWRKNAQADGDHKEKMTLEEARNAMLDAQVKDTYHYAVRIEDGDYTDPFDGYEGTRPMQNVYVITDSCAIRLHSTHMLNDYISEGKLPYGWNETRKYERVEYEELEKIASKMREPIDTYKAVLRAEKEQTEEHKLSDAYYEQRAMDVLEEHYKAGEGAFERNIENPKYLSGMLYAEETLRGERVVSLTQGEDGKYTAIIVNSGGAYVLAEDYRPDDGRTWGKRLVFSDKEAAEKFRVENYPSAGERTSTASDKSNYALAFSLNYGNELLMSRALRELGYEKDQSVGALNNELDDKARESNSALWTNSIAYNGADGKRIEGIYLRESKFGGVMVEATDIIGFTCSNMTVEDAQNIAKIVRGFGAEVNIAEIKGADKAAENTATSQHMAKKPHNTFCTDFGGEYMYFIANDGLTIDDVCNGYAINPNEGFGYRFGREITERQYKEIQDIGKGFNIDFLDDINAFTITQDGKVIDSGYLYEDLVLKYQERSSEVDESAATLADAGESKEQEGNTVQSNENINYREAVEKIVEAEFMNSHYAQTNDTLSYKGQGYQTIRNYFKNQKEQNLEFLDERQYKALYQCHEDNNSILDDLWGEYIEHFDGELASDESVTELIEQFTNTYYSDTLIDRNNVATSSSDSKESDKKTIAEDLSGKSVWLKINLQENAIGGQYGNNTLVRMPDGEFSHFGVFVPSKFIKNDNGKVQLNVGSKFTYRLTNDGREVNLTGQELADSFAGKAIGKEIVRVAPSRKYAQTLANLEKNVPTELKEIPTWCCYRTKWNEEKGKKDKFIISPMDGKWASSKEPNRWTTFEAALKYARENNCEGLSLLLDKQYGITCIDLDKCITDAQTGAMKERATKLVKELEDTYIERSTSGNGVHIFLKDDILKNGTYNNTSMVKDDNPKGDIEVFDDKRIISMTGDMLSANNNLTRARSAATLYLRQELGERRQQTASGAKPQTHGSANLSDKELIQWIQKSKQGNKFNDLYSGKGVSGDRSGDDGKLAHMLLYFNGGDKEQAFRIMRESGLNRTDKPDSYYRHTIDKMNDKIGEYAKRPSLGAPKQQNKSVAGKGKPGAQA